MKITNINLSKIVRNENQPRKHFDDDAIKELSQSIKKDGLMQPIIVRKVSRDTFGIVQGERRYRAAELVGLTEIPAFIREMDDAEAFHLAVIENIQREQLTPIEEAQAFQKYVEMGFTHTEIAEKVSKGRTYVTSRLRLLKLSPAITDWLANGFLTEGHARQILKLESIMNRLLKNAEIIGDSPFNHVQSLFYQDYWYDEVKNKKVTVKEVQRWADNLRYQIIRAIAEHLRNNNDSVIAYSLGHEINAELFCRMYNLEPSLLIDEDYSFAIEYEREYLKDSFDEDFRPWMIDKYWDEVQNISNDWIEPRNLRLSDMRKQEIKERNLDEITESIKQQLDKLEKAKAKLSDMTGKTPEEIEEEVFE